MFRALILFNRIDKRRIHIVVLVHNVLGNASNCIYVLIHGRGRNNFLLIYHM